MSNTKSKSAKIALPLPNPHPVFSLPNPHPIFSLPHRPPPRVPEIVFGESKTEQCHKDSCDINLIVACFFACLCSVSNTKLPIDILQKACHNIDILQKACHNIDILQKTCLL